jgi:hypothetical protein
MIAPKEMMCNRETKETMSNRRAKKTYHKKMTTITIAIIAQIIPTKQTPKKSTINNKATREMMSNKKTMKTDQNHTTTITIVVLAQNVPILPHKSCWEGIGFVWFKFHHFQKLVGTHG